MILINSLEHYKLETDNYSGIYCTLFVRPTSPPCLVMERVLSILCEANNMKLLTVPVNNRDFFRLIEKYNVGVLPRYLFIKEEKELYEDYGTQTLQDIKKTLSRLEV